MRATASESVMDSGYLFSVSVTIIRKREIDPCDVINLPVVREIDAACRACVSRNREICAASFMVAGPPGRERRKVRRDQPPISPHGLLVRRQRSAARRPERRHSPAGPRSRPDREMRAQAQARCLHPRLGLSPRPHDPRADECRKSPTTMGNLNLIPRARTYRTQNRPEADLNPVTWNKPT